MRSGKKTLLLVIIVAVSLIADFGDADARRRRRRRHSKKAKPAKVKASTPTVEAPTAQPVTSAPAAAAPAKKRKKRVQVLDFSGIGIEGRLRTPQLLYFLGRVKEELHRASLEKRSFVPELVRSAEEGGF